MVVPNMFESLKSKMSHQTPQQQTLSPLGLPCYAEGKKLKNFTPFDFFKWAWFKEDENDGAYKQGRKKLGSRIMIIM